jgi:hypothetical protein
VVSDPSTESAAGSVACVGSVATTDSLVGTETLAVSTTVTASMWVRSGRAPTPPTVFDDADSSGD